MKQFKFIKQTTILFVSGTAILGTPVTALAATFNLQEATIADINAAFDAGALSSVGLTQLYLNRIDAYDKQGPSLNSIITINPNAQETALALDQERQLTGPRSPLHGIPVIVKDNYDTFDLPTSAGATIFKDFIPQDDAFQVQKLREAGAIVLAKANLSEFAFSGSESDSSLGGITRNAYDPARTPAGSSGGTAVAIAANFGVVGLGTDTGSSIRNPSSFNSLVGVRPTIGLSSRAGIIPLALSQDVGGPMTRTVTDAAVVLDATAGFDPNDPVTASSTGKIPDYADSLDPNGLQGSRIGVVRALLGPDTNPESAKVNEVINAAIADLDNLGAEVVDDVTIPNLDRILAYPSLSGFEFRDNLNDYLAARPEAPVRTLTEIIASGGYLPSNETTLITRNNVEPLETNARYQEIIRDRPVLTQQSILTALNLNDLDPENDLDALIYPTVTSPPGLIGQPASFGSNVRLSPFSGFPAVTVPAGFTSDDRPVGIEFLGEAFSESTLLSLAYSYEQGTLNRLPPTTTPALPGETFEYEPVPEPSATIGLALFGLTALGLKLKQKRKV